MRKISTFWDENFASFSRFMALCKPKYLKKFTEISQKNREEKDQKSQKKCKKT